MWLVPSRNVPKAAEDLPQSFRKPPESIQEIYNRFEDILKTRLRSVEACFRGAACVSYICSVLACFRQVFQYLFSYAASAMLRSNFNTREFNTREVF